MAARVTLLDPTPENVAVAVTAEFLPLYNELTTSDLQGSISAAVQLHGLKGDAAYLAECLSLDSIYEAQEGK
jgi:hypothetical protein